MNVLWAVEVKNLRHFHIHIHTTTIYLATKPTRQLMSNGNEHPNFIFPRKYYFF